MDPVTHGVVGATAALSICERWAKNSSRAVRFAAMGCGLVAAELPDADRIVDHCFRPYGDDGQGLAYMLYHRGPTHTVLACFAFTLLVAALATAVLRTRSTFWLFSAAALAGVSLHLAMDSMNDYGVHPFPPVSQRWFYGDFLFLAEPTVSATLLPCLLVLLGVRTRWSAWISLALGIAGVSTLLILEQWLQLFGAVVTVVWLALQVLAQRKQLRLGFAWLSLLVVLTAFAVGSFCARSRVADWARARGLAPLTDVATTPAPGDPLCWRFITLTRKGDTFEEHLGVVDLSPWSRARQCFSPPSGNRGGRRSHGVVTPSAGATPESVCLPRPALADADAEPGFHEFASFYGRISEFERLAEDPYVDATRHFLRLPFWGHDARREPCVAPVAREPQEAAPESHELIGDLRVDYDKQDLAHFCKYAFVTKRPASKQPFEPLMPVGAPPLLQHPAR